MGHDMAPVAGAVANAQKDGLILCTCFGKSLLAPGIPVHRVIRVLEKVRACLIFQMIAQILTSFFRLPVAGLSISLPASVKREP